MKYSDVIWQLKSGNLVILPTETVYGLFADALNQVAVEKLYKIKDRPKEKGLNLNVASYESLRAYSQNQPSYLEKLVKSFLPGPLTLILEASSRVPGWINGGGATVGFRIPNHPATLEVIRHFDVLVGPSANLSGQPSPVTFKDLDPKILGAAAASIQDDSVFGRDTTILSLTSDEPRILRQGDIQAQQLLEKVPEMVSIL